MRRSLTATEVTEKSRRIWQHLRAFVPFQQARTLILYSADENEVQTEAIWQSAVAQGRTVYYPRATPDQAELEFVRRFASSPLVPGAFGILTPSGNELLLDLHATDIVLTPGVGFDRQGHRLGRGRGYYDRAFGSVLAGALRVALAYECQIIPLIPTNVQDERVQYIVTERGIIDCAIGDFLPASES